MADNTSGGFVAVGAASTHAPWTETVYSAQGPNTGGAIKPDLLGPDDVRSYDNSNFNGTSAAAPLVAGMAALYKAKYPSVNPIDIKSFLNTRTIDIGTPGWDNQTGSGRAHLGAPPLGIGMVAPSTGAQRIYDSRPLNNFIAPNTIRRIAVSPDEYAVLINVTTTDHCCGGYVTVFPGDLITPPAASTLNPASSPSHNLTLVQIPQTGPFAHTFAVYSTDQLNVVVDKVASWKATGGSVGNLHMLPNPVRAVDTRPAGNCDLCGIPTGYPPGSFAPITPGPVAAGARQHFQITNRNFAGGVSVPIDAFAVFLHVTMVTAGPVADGNGFLTVEPYTTASYTPGVSTINPATSIAFNGWVTALNSGSISVFSTGTAYVIVDVVGYWTFLGGAPKGGVTPITPVRVMDSRTGFQGDGVAPQPLGPFSGARDLVINGRTFNGVTIPEDANTVIFNVTVTNHCCGGYVVIYPSTMQAPPVASMVNPVKPIASSLSGVQVPIYGNQPQPLRVFASDPVDVIVDVVGYSRDP